MNDEWSLQKLLKILFIIFLVCVIFALVFKGIVSITKKASSKQKKETEQVETKKETKKKKEEKQTEESQDLTNVTYSDLENRIKLGAQRYENDNYQGTMESSETWILKYNMLKEKGYVENKLLDPNGAEECTGYVVFKKEEAKITYIPYIKCGNNYKTAGYDETN